MLVLVFVSIILPYRMAFYDNENSVAWTCVWLFIDVYFLIDVILTFFTTFTDAETNVEVANHKRIAIKYLKGWFFIDILSIIPFDIIIDGNSSYNILARILRTSRLYKLLRLLRLMKIIKLAKNDKKVTANHEQKMKIRYGTERLIFFTSGFLILIHVTGCLFIILE